MKNASLIRKVRELCPPDVPDDKQIKFPGRGEKIVRLDVFQQEMRRRTFIEEFETGRRWPWNYKHMEEYRMVIRPYLDHNKVKYDFYYWFYHFLENIKVHEGNIEWVRGIVKKFLTGVLRAPKELMSKEVKASITESIYRVLRFDCVIISEAETTDDYFERFFRGEGKCLHRKPKKRIKNLKQRLRHLRRSWRKSVEKGLLWALKKNYILRLQKIFKIFWVNIRVRIL